jgi:hypothetical protein
VRNLVVRFGDELLRLRIDLRLRCGLLLLVACLLASFPLPHAAAPDGKTGDEDRD